jgi:hypothetical protein
VESEGRQMKQCRTQYSTVQKKEKIPLLMTFCKKKHISLSKEFSAAFCQRKNLQARDLSKICYDMSNTIAKEFLEHEFQKAGFGAILT